MPSSCCVIGCKSRGTAQPGVQFFQLPLNKPTILTQWLIVLDRRDWIPKPSSRICSLHFSTDDYILRPNQSSPRLKPDAIPSVFPDLGDEEEGSSSPEKENDNKTVENEIKELNKPSKSKTPKSVSLPVIESPLQRPRRVSKVSSKMKDFILLDDIKKHKSLSSPVSKLKGDREGDPGVYALLSVLEDSNSLSGDESKLIASSSKTRNSKNTNNETKIGVTFSSALKKQSPSTSSLPAKNNLMSTLKMKPGPASVKKAKQLSMLQNLDSKSKGSPEVKSSTKPLYKPGKTIPPEYRKTYFQVKDGNKVLFLSYADLNPVTDMTKNNVLFPPKTTDSDEPKEAEQETGDEGSPESEIIPEGLRNDLPSVDILSPPPKNNVRGRKRVTKKILNVENGLNDASVSDALGQDDVEMIDSDSDLKTVPDKSTETFDIVETTMASGSSPVKRKKRFKTVAEIVVRTDNSGAIPNVSIEKMTSLESNETPRKKVKLSNKPLHTPVENINTEFIQDEEDLSNLSERVIETIRKMRLLESRKGKESKLTVLITTLPPVQENELLIIKKKNTVTQVEQSRDLRVAFSSFKGTTPSTSASGLLLPSSVALSPQIMIPIIGACDIDPLEKATKPDNNSDPTMNQESTEILSPEQPGTATDKVQSDELSEGGLTNSAPLQHDHTYISPSLKVGETEIVVDEQAKDIFSKLKLSEEEISYRSKVHRKIRFLKETVKRKNESVQKLKQKLLSIEKSLREERKNKKKIALGTKKKPGYEPNRIYEGLLESGGSKSVDFNVQHMDLPLEFDENPEESDDEGRGSSSPITYICEPAIDVCEKNTSQD